MDDLEERTARALAGNLHRDADKLARQHKLFVRDRLDLLCDKGTFVEDGLLANALADDLPADGVITGVGRVEGRAVCVMANDPTVKAGSWGARTVEKIVRLTEHALRHELPIFWLIDSAGARITDQVELFPGGAAPGGSSPTKCDCRARSRRSVACSGRRRQGARTSRAFAMWCSWWKAMRRCTSGRPAWPRRSSAST
jgi:hypothetical protein